MENKIEIQNWKENTKIEKLNNGCSVRMPTLALKLELVFIGITW